MVSGQDCRFAASCKDTCNNGLFPPVEYPAFRGLIPRDGEACPFPGRIITRGGQSMEKEKWYAVQVRTGKEDLILNLCRKVIDRRILSECFIAQCERMKRYQGTWHKEPHPMFPGYVFLITDEVEKLFYELKQLPELTKILGDGTEFISLREEEKEFLLRIGGNSHFTEISTGNIIGGQIQIISGPLKGMEGQITYIDRHKRIAKVIVDMFGRMVEVKMGLEVAMKVADSTLK